MKKIVIPLLLVGTLAACGPDAPEQSAKFAPAAVALVPASSPVAVQPVSAVAAKSAVTDDAAVRALAQKNGCFACHTLDTNLVGPAWRKVAAKYRGQGDAEAKLVEKVARGGSGVWGKTAMPPNSPKVSEADTKTLVRYILTLQ